MERAYVINIESGELQTTLNDGDRILRKKSQEYLDGTVEWKIEHFFKGNLQEIIKLMKELTGMEKAILFTIAPFVGYEDCCIKFNNGTPLTFNDIMEYSCLSKGAVSQAINGLIKKDIVCKAKNSANRLYFVNPWVFCKGARINKVLQTMFSNYRIRIMHGRKWKDCKGYID